MHTCTHTHIPTPPPPHTHPSKISSGFDVKFLQTVFKVFNKVGHLRRKRGGEKGEGRRGRGRGIGEEGKGRGEKSRRGKMDHHIEWASDAPTTPDHFTQ